MRGDDRANRTLRVRASLTCITRSCKSGSDRSSDRGSFQELLSGTTQRERQVSIDRLRTHLQALPPPCQAIHPTSRHRAVSLQGRQTVCRGFKDDGERSPRNFAIGKSRRGCYSLRRTIEHVALYMIQRSIRLLGTPPLASLTTPEFLERCLPTSGLATLVAQ